MFSFRQPTLDHVCGLYYTTTAIGAFRLERTYIPQVKLEAHATILSTTAKVNLKQTFVNPDQDRGIKEVRYTFPLYDGVSVVGFTCHVGGRTIVGEVKEREKAKAVFDEAVAQGQTAGLLEQLPNASDVFTTTIGNIPPGAEVVVSITYLGELKHDLEVDGTRFMIPTKICPRYGNYPSALYLSSAIDALGKSISITVDAQMAEGSFIQRIQSPSHPISIQMGNTSVAPDAEPTMTRASANLTLGTAELETDFILQIIAKDTGVPKALLENHPTIPNHRALMATLVPKFALPAEKPEIVFVCDRSGSMGGTRIQLAVEALKVFLKSLPVGVKFNICSFGSACSFLWPRSVTYSQQTLDEAVRHAETFQADYGGTEMLEPLRKIVQQRYQDMPLDVMLLTDGEIWNQDALFSYLNEVVQESKQPVRMFTLGIGDGVSHALIEGVAKAGNGFSQSVTEGEKMDTKVVRMLKGALSPHINDYTLEVKYHSSVLSDDLDDFEIIEKVANSLNVKLDLKEEQQAQPQQQRQPISLFDTSVDPDKEEPVHSDDSGEQKYAHLPTLASPKIIQAPQNIPALYAFNRTTVYLLLGPDAPQDTPASVILRGTSKHGPLELEIPISILDIPGETIHQLAAKKAVAELEQGRGWLPEAKNETGVLVKTKYEGRFSDMVEREAVRLGVQFQVGGKWTSFVAVEKRGEDAAQEENSQNWGWLDIENDLEGQQDGVKQMLDIMQQQQQRMGINRDVQQPQMRMTYQQAQASQPRMMSMPAQVVPQYQARKTSSFIQSKRPDLRGLRQLFRAPEADSSGSPSTSLFQRQPSASRSAPGAVLFGAAPASSSRGLFGSSQRLSAGASAFGQASTPTAPGSGPFGQSSASRAPSSPFASGQSFGASPAFAIQSAAPTTQLFGASSASPKPSFGSSSLTSPSHHSVFAASAQAAPSAPASSLFGASSPLPPPPPPPPPAPAPFRGHGTEGEELKDYHMGLLRLEQQNKKRLLMARQQNDGSPLDFPTTNFQSMPAPPSPSAHVNFNPTTTSTTNDAQSLTRELISHQLFSGSFPYSPSILTLFNISPDFLRNAFSAFAGVVSEEAIMTALVIVLFETRLEGERGSWELVVEKARGWLEGEVGDWRAEELIVKAKGVVSGN